MSKLYKRDTRIDIMRAIAIICIAVAHSAPGGFIFQLRNFDVICMVMLMGTSAYISNKDGEIKYIQYLYKRVKRLLLPMILFLTLFFIIFYMISLIQGEDYYFDMNTIIRSYTLIDGIGYVWIIRVFILVSMAIPFILQLNKNIDKNYIYGCVIIIAYIIYVILLDINNNLDGAVRFIYENFIIYGVLYSIIAAIGVRLNKLSKNEIRLIILSFLLIFSYMMILNGFTPTQEVKYPPRMYYISYGIFMTLFIYRLISMERIYRMLDNKFIKFISYESMNIYIYHILGIYLLKLAPGINKIFGTSFITRFIFIFGLGITITLIKIRYINKLKLKYKSKSKTVN